MSSEHISFVVEGMSCDHCVQSIKTALSQLNGVYEVMVDIDSKRVAVEYDQERLDIDTLKGTIEDAGFRVK
jgi:copper chaperone